MDPTDVQFDADRAFEILGQKLGRLEVENAKLQAVIAGLVNAKNDPPTAVTSDADR